MKLNENNQQHKPPENLSSCDGHVQEKNEMKSDSAKESSIDRKYCSLREAAIYLDVSKTTLWRWQKDEKLAVSHQGGRAWVKISDLDALVESGFNKQNKELN